MLVDRKDGFAILNAQSEVPMTAIDVQTLYDYSYWANAKLFEPLSRLTTEEFVRPVAGSYGSLRNTLVHMMSAEGGWLDRCGGPKRGAPLMWEDFPSLEAITTYWAGQERKMRAFLAGLTDADLSRRIEFTVPQISFSHVMALGEMLHHAAIHNIHHRGQVTLLLRELGHAPGNVDILFYYAEKGASAEV
jgi:uncharacterized damage-inducible protein DinB